MATKAKTINGAKVFKCSDALSIWEAAQMWTDLISLLQSKSKKPAVIDLSGVESIDGAGLQILCQIRQAVEQKKRTIQVTGLSEALASVVKQAGMDPQFFMNPLEEV